MLKEYLIKDFNGTTYSFDEFIESVEWHTRNGFTTYIGTDSKVNKDKIFLVSVICFHAQDKSGKVFSVSENIMRKLYPSLRARMLLEANRSLEIAIELDPHVKGRLEIHLDVGDTIKSKTSAYEQELQSLIVSQGFICEIKPNSWASSSVADKVTR